MHDERDRLHCLNIGVRYKTVDDVASEIFRARSKNPTNEGLLAALTEEFLELVRAFNDNEGPERVYAEAMQVACVAMRIMEEGNS